MLVLSRHEGEKILLPQLGITIEVARIKRKSVALGIDAPNNIRVIREELRNREPRSIPIAAPIDRLPSNWNAPNDAQACLEAANLAIHLAQNLIQQQRTSQATNALEDALECLGQLESFCAQQSMSATSKVHESQSKYRSGRKKIALVLNQNQPLADEYKNRLDQLGYATTQLDSGESLIRFLKQEEQPNLVLSLKPSAKTKSTRSSWPLVFSSPIEAFDDSPQAVSKVELESPDDSSLRIFGVGNLQKSCRTFPAGPINVTGWFCDTEDEDALIKCIG